MFGAVLVEFGVFCGNSLIRFCNLGGFKLFGVPFWVRFFGQSYYILIVKWTQKLHQQSC